jgi:outer membrane immunogenic protein
MTDHGRGFSRAAAFGFAVASAVLCVGSARAADLPVKAVPAHAPYNWNGCYVGGFFGWNQANTWHSNDVNNFNPGGATPWVFSLGAEPTGGGYAGCSWQPTPGGGFVLSLEAEGAYMNMRGVQTQYQAGNVSDLVHVGSGYGLVAGRVGWVFFEKILVYGKIGVAFFDENSTISGTNVAGVPISATGSKTQSPLAFGGGGEFPITDHWIGRMEYLAFEGGSSYNAIGTVGHATFTWKEDPSLIQSLKIGAAYKF